MKVSLQWRCRPDWRSPGMAGRKWHEYNECSKSDAQSFMRNKAVWDDIFEYRLKEHVSNGHSHKPKPSYEVIEEITAEIKCT